MLAIKIIWFYVLFFSLACGTGLLITKRNEVTLMAIVYGFCYVLALFQALELVALLLDWDLTTLTLSWVAIAFISALLGIKRNIVSLSKIVKLKRQGFRFTNINAVLFMAIILMVFQIIYITIMMHDDADDATFVATAVTSYLTNTVETYAPLTGATITSLSYRSFSAWPTFWAVLAQLTGIHPAIIMHTLSAAPLVLIAYIIYYKVGQILFQNDQKRAELFFLFMNIINIFGNTSVCTRSTFLLFRIWQGKAFLGAALIPLLIYQAFIFERTQRPYSKLMWIQMFIIVSAGCCTSTTAVMLFPPCLVLYYGYSVISNKTFSDIWKYALCLSPCLLYALLILA